MRGGGALKRCGTGQLVYWEISAFNLCSFFGIYMFMGLVFLCLCNCFQVYFFLPSSYLPVVCLFVCLVTYLRLSLFIHRSFLPFLRLFFLYFFLSFFPYFLTTFLLLPTFPFTLTPALFSSFIRFLFPFFPLDFQLSHFHSLFFPRFSLEENRPSQGRSVYLARV